VSRRLKKSEAHEGIDAISSSLLGYWTFTGRRSPGELHRYRHKRITNPLSAPASEFTIFFNANQFSNLAVVASPAGWSSIVAQPDLGLPADGFFDTLSLTTGLLPGGSQSGFSVQTKYGGSGDPVTFENLNVGNTTPSSSGGGGGGGGGGGALNAPEIDPASAVTAITFLFGCLVLLQRPKARRF
jgi:hypothetical protein